MNGPRLVFAVAAWLFVAGIVIQVFLAGAGLFKLTDFTPHGYLGWYLPLVPVVLLILAAVARVDRRTMLLTAVLLLLTMIQPMLAAERKAYPVLAAFHPVNALLVFWLAWTVSRRGTDLIRVADRQPAIATD
jgi:mercuric ion transport protein